MKKSIIGLLLLILTAQASAKEINISLALVFKWSDAVWGTYELQDESVKSIDTNIKKNAIGKALFQNGNIHLIRPKQINGETSFQVLEMPFKSTKTGRHTRRYKINSKKHKKEIISTYDDLIKSAISHVNYDELSMKEIEIKSMNCNRNKSKLNCNFNFSYNSLDKTTYYVLKKQNKLFPSI